jgi:hypothetical protein
MNNDCRGEKYCLGLITFNLENGHHAIDVRLTDTPVRKIGNILTLLSLGAVLIVLVRNKK